jgi:chromosome segregation ATPase
MAEAALSPWIVVGIASAVAALGWLLWRSERRFRVRAERDVGELCEQSASLEAELSRRARSAEKRSQELIELRRKLDKTKKRAFEASGGTVDLEARIGELEERLRAREQETREARDAAARITQELVGERHAVAELRQKVLPLEHAAPEDREDLAKLKRRAEAAETQVKQLTEKLKNAEREASRYRTRERTHRRLYAAIKGELDVLKDRLRTLERARGDPASRSSPNLADSEALEDASRDSSA